MKQVAKHMMRQASGIAVQMEKPGLVALTAGGLGDAVFRQHVVIIIQSVQPVTF